MVHSPSAGVGPCTDRAHSPPTAPTPLQHGLACTRAWKLAVPWSQLSFPFHGRLCYLLILSHLLSRSLLPLLVLAVLPMVTSCAVGRHERLDQVQALPLAQSQTWEVRFIFPTALAEEVWVHKGKKKKKTGIRCSVTEASCGIVTLWGEAWGSPCHVSCTSGGGHRSLAPPLLLFPPTFLSYPPSMANTGVCSNRTDIIISLG